MDPECQGIRNSSQVISLDILGKRTAAHRNGFLLRLKSETSVLWDSITRIPCFGVIAEVLAGRPFLLAYSNFERTVMPCHQLRQTRAILTIWCSEFQTQTTTRLFMPSNSVGLELCFVPTAN